MILKRIEQAEKAWKAAGANVSGSYCNALAQIELHKRLLNFFQIGDYFMVAFNLSKLRIEYVSEGIRKVLGYTPDEFSLSFFLSLIHWDDETYFINFEKKVVDIFGSMPSEEQLNYKVRYDYRLRCKDGSYKRMLHQMMITEIDEEQQNLKTLTVLTDITDLKTSGAPILSLIGLNGRPSLCNIPVRHDDSEEDLDVVVNVKLTAREQQILMLIAEGYNSKEISERLFLSKHTVDTHRKNILRKSKASNLNQLISQAIKEGLL